MLNEKQGSIDDAFKNKVLPILALLFCFVFLLFVRFHVNHSITGDEPHYLLMDYSLEHDHDLNLKNNYQDMNYYSWYPAKLGLTGQVDAKQVAINSPKLYSIHGIGLPLLVLPAFILDGPKAVEVEMVLIAVVVIWLVWLWCFTVTKNRSLSYVASAILASCYFFNGLAGYIYPDMVIAGVTLGALYILYKHYDNFWYQVLFGALIGYLVLLHFKTLSIAAPLFVLMVYRCYSHTKKLPWGILVPVIPIVGYFFYFLHHSYGVWDPSSILNSNVSINTSPLKTIPAMLFDSKLGLLVYNPIILLVFVGVFPWIKRNKVSFILTMLALLPSIILLTLFDGWDAGYAPGGRYIIEFLPALLPAMIFSLELMKSWWQKIIVGLLLAMTVFVTIENIKVKLPYVDDLLPTQRAALFVSIENQTRLSPDKLLPKYSYVSTGTTYLIQKDGSIKVVIYSIGVLALVGYGYVIARPLKPLKSDKRI